MTLTLPLDGLTDADAGRAGAKAVTLARLRRAGVATPGGFVVTTEAYDLFMGHSAIGDRLRPLAEGTANIGERAEAHGALRTTNVPSAVYEAVEGALAAAGLTRELAAVRPSPISEVDAAGVYRGALDVRGLLAVVDRVKAVWISAWAAPAVGHRMERGLGPRAARMAALVQPMVDADWAGTARPGPGGAVVVEAVGGVGADWAGVEAAVWTVGRDGEVEGPGGGGAGPTVEGLRAVARLPDQVSNALGGAQVVSWALEDGRLWVLTARGV